MEENILNELDTLIGGWSMAAKLIDGYLHGVRAMAALAAAGETPSDCDIDALNAQSNAILSALDALTEGV